VPFVAKSPMLQRPSLPPSSGERIPLMMKIKTPSETLGHYPKLTRFFAQEKVTELSSRDSFTSYREKIIIAGSVVCVR
jgi:hypothetical protein